MEFKILDAADPLNRKAWIDLWTKWPQREIFAHPEYLRLNARPNDRALCAVASVGESHILYPFLLRSLGDEPFCALSQRDCADITTPYGYGGPFRCGDAWDPNSIYAFWQEFGSWAARSRVVSEVVRLSLFPETLVEYAGDRRVISDNVVRTINSADQLWWDFEHKVRKNVNTAHASGVEVCVDESGERLDEFLSIYIGTMNRRNAEENYYFPREYFERLHADLKGQFVYFHAVIGGAIVSTELVLVSANRIYSFLGGTDVEWFHVRPNDLLKVEIMNWARCAGKAEFVLGGGAARGDGIYRYKLSFAPSGSVPFSLGCRVLRPDDYEQLVHARRSFEAAEDRTWQPNPEYFPVYRG